MNYAAILLSDISAKYKFPAFTNCAGVKSRLDFSARERWNEYLRIDNCEDFTVLWQCRHEPF